MLQSPFIGLSGIGHSFQLTISVQLQVQPSASLQVSPGEIKVFVQSSLPEVSIALLAVQSAEVPQLVPLQVQSQGQVPDTELASPSSQRFELGLLATVVPLVDQQAQFVVVVPQLVQSDDLSMLYTTEEASQDHTSIEFPLKSFQMSVQVKLL